MHQRNPKAEDVVAHVDRTWGAACEVCGQPLIGHEAVIGLMLGFGKQPLCATHLAALHSRSKDDFLSSAHRNVARLACYRAGWLHSDQRLALDGPWPEERLPSRLRMDPEEDEGDLEDEEGASWISHAPASLAEHLADSPRLDSWDAGDRGCGELALELKLRMRRLEPGDRLILVTTDAGAPADLPAWCRLTGNVLVAAEPPRFLIECAKRSQT